MAKLELPAYIVNALKQVALDHGFKDAQFYFSESSGKGTVGLTKKCRIKEDEKCLSIMCKFLPNDEELNRKFDSYELFKREVYVYQKLHPQMQQFQIDHGMSFRDNQGFWAFPKCYSSNYNEEHPEKSFILMEDLSAEGFETKDSFKMADFDHTKNIFIELAKLHGASFALKAKQPEVFAEFKLMNDLMCRLMTTDLMKDIAPRNCQLASELFSLPLIRDKILSFKDNLWKQIEVLLDAAKAEPFGVICHGDCWISNVMFNYKDEALTEIKTVRFIDWQMTRFGSGPTELMYFLFCYTEKTLRDEYQEELLKIYYETLREMMKKFGLDVDLVYPLTRFEEEVKAAGKFAFAMASFAGPINCKYPEKLFNDKQATLTDDEKLAVSLYNRRMRDVVSDLIGMDAL